MGKKHAHVKERLYIKASTTQREKKVPVNTLMLQKNEIRQSDSTKKWRDIERAHPVIRKIDVQSNSVMEHINKY